MTAATIAGTGLIAWDHIYTPGLDRPLQALGGSCGNVPACLAMLGHRAVPIAAIGQDAAGELIWRAIARAGCTIDLLRRRDDFGSPIVVQHLDPARAAHRFSFHSPETGEAYARWRTIDAAHVEAARATLAAVSVFYTDRLSPAIVSAMAIARNAGALVYFEPDLDWDSDLLERALPAVSILKIADDTPGIAIAQAALAAGSAMTVIRTHGAAGLTLTCSGMERFFPGFRAPRLVDSCGAGDMLTTGLLDRLLRRQPQARPWPAEDIVAGVELGQRLAALNCAFIGARGAFHALGAARIRSGLDHWLDQSFLAQAMAHGPDQGY